MSDDATSPGAQPNDDDNRHLPRYIHHVNFPTTDVDRTVEWYTKVFGMQRIMPKSNTKVVLLTRGGWDLHFTPVQEMERMSPYHFAVEVEDFEGFLKHLENHGVRYTRPLARPENRSQFCYIHDPDHTMIEIVYHPNKRLEVELVVNRAAFAQGPEAKPQGA